MAELPVTPVKVQPASAKATGQGAARQSEAADSDKKTSSFSSELNKRMDADKAGREASARDSGKATTTGKEETTDSAGGKKLPAGEQAGQARGEDGESREARAQLDSALLADGEGQTAEAQSGEETEVSPLALAQMLLDAAPPKTGGEAGAEGRALKTDSGRTLPDAARLLSPASGSDSARPQLTQSLQDALQDGELPTDLFRQFMARGGEQRSETSSAQLAQLAARNPDAAGLQRLVSADAMVNQTPAAAQGMPQTAQLNPAGGQSALPTTQIPLPLQHPQWDDALSEKVMWATNQKLQGAEIKLNPPHLGPIEVRVSLNNDSGQSQAQVHFTAQHALTRDALESAMPRLRDMFNANGMDLVDVNVSDRSFSEQDRDTAQAQQEQFMSGLSGGGDMEEGAGEVSTKITQLPSSALDLFA